MRYGLIVWLRAESAEVLAADLRALASDNGIGVQGLRNEEVVAEVRAKLKAALSKEQARYFFRSSPFPALPSPPALLLQGRPQWR